MRAGPALSKAGEPLEAPASGLSPAPPSCQSRTYLGMSTLRDLIFKRPSRQFQYLHVLLDLSSHEKDKVIPHRPGPFPSRGPSRLPPQSPGRRPSRSSSWVGVVFPRMMS